MRTRTALIAPVLAALAIGASPAQAAPYETMIQDDQVLLYGSDSDVGTGMAVLHSLGVDRARITVPWSLAAPRPNDRRKPRRFRADKPDAYAPSLATYRSSFMYNVDRAVLDAAAYGVKLDLDLGFGAPRWAAAGFGTKDRVGAVNRPSPTEFARFARAQTTPRVAAESDEHLVERPLILGHHPWSPTIMAWLRGPLRHDERTIEHTR